MQASDRLEEDIEETEEKDMIAMRANSELKMTFERLIETMRVPVEWNGLFIVINNYIILQGNVRSLVFYFDERKVVTNIIDLEVPETAIREIANDQKVCNVINMLLYSFGKWDAIPGLRVEKNFVQLNQLFSNILKEINVECKYERMNFFFYQEGMRITYEDVIQAALEKRETEVETEHSAKEQGLWHKMCWQNIDASLQTKETSVEERRQTRIGHNFYLVSYLCPKCNGRMHMVVYPEQKEFQIETEEGEVLLARACTCPDCCSFYTPRPKQLLAEGKLYVMDFMRDQTAYEDYLELLGRNGDMVSNYNYNRFADPKKNVDDSDEMNANEEKRRLEKLTEADLDYIISFTDWMKVLPEKEFARLSARVAEGFYPLEQVAKIARQLEKEKKKRQKRENGERTESKEKESIVGNTELTKNDSGTRKTEKLNKELINAKNGEEIAKEIGTIEKRVGIEKTAQAGNEEAFTPEFEPNETVKKFSLRIAQFPRLSERQKRELQLQIEKEASISEETKKNLLQEIRDMEQRDNLEKIRLKAQNIKGKNYAVLERIYEEVKNSDIPDKEKETMLSEIETEKNEQAEREVRQLLEKKPAKMDRKSYQAYVDKIRSYKGVDIGDYEEELLAGINEAEEQEIKHMIQHSRVNTREDLQELLNRMLARDFTPELFEKYEKKVKEKIRALDEAAIDELLGDMLNMDFESAKEAYDAISVGPFLPELKADALKQLEKRLSKIKTDECELLVEKLKQDLKNVNIDGITEHHFYPAKKVLLKEASPEEVGVIEYAVASYAAGIGPFEYPILVVDTSRNKKGDKGFILTPEKLFYSNMTTAYHISVFSIDSIEASTGLLNRGLYVYQNNGVKTKIPYAVENSQLESFANVLDSYVKYLQEKPFSRKETYLAKENHDTICCFRCGNVYRGGGECPKCGYKMNG